MRTLSIALRAESSKAPSTSAGLEWDDVRGKLRRIYSDEVRFEKLSQSSVVSMLGLSEF